MKSQGDQHARVTMRRRTLEWGSGVLLISFARGGIDSVHCVRQHGVRSSANMSRCHIVSATTITTTCVIVIDRRAPTHLFVPKDNLIVMLDVASSVGPLLQLFIIAWRRSLPLPLSSLTQCSSSVKRLPHVSSQRPVISHESMATDVAHELCVSSRAVSIARHVPTHIL